MTEHVCNSNERQVEMLVCEQTKFCPFCEQGLCIYEDTLE